MEKIWISYNDNGKRIEGYFYLVEQKEAYVKIMSNKNVITIPFHKINKIKQKGGKVKI